MDVGLFMVFASYGWDNCLDKQVWDEEIRLARLAADLGFDCLWSAEHHFNDYSFVPDNLQLMSYLTAACPDIDLGTAAVIVPWHDPLRVAEQAAVLENGVPVGHPGNVVGHGARATRGATHERIVGRLSLDTRVVAASWRLATPVDDETLAGDNEE